MRFSGFSMREVSLLEQWTKANIARRKAPPLTGARGLLIALRISFRAARLVFATQPHERLRVVGPILVFDHPAETLLRILIRERPPGPQLSRPQLSRWARARGAVEAALVGCLSLSAFYRYLGVGGKTSEAHLVKGLVAFSHARAVLRQFACTAVVVTHDLVPRPYFTALAASRAGVPIWMTLLDHELRTMAPFRLSGIIGYQPHDACGMSPQPPVFVTLPVRPRRLRLQGGNALQGLVLLSHPDNASQPEDAVVLGKFLLEDPRVVSIRVRPHPSHPVHFGTLPPSLELDDMNRLLEDSLADVHFVVCFAGTSALRTVSRAGIPSFTVDAKHVEREALVLRTRLDNLMADDAFSELDRYENACPFPAHPDVVDFAALWARFGF